MSAALAELRASCTLSINDATRRHGITRSALSKRSHAETSRAESAESRRMLNDQQEEELMNYTYQLCERCLPPTPRIVANIVQELFGRKISKNWSSRFVVRHKHRLDARYLSTIDSHATRLIQELALRLISHQ